jgi:hypothetical protein
MNEPNDAQTWFDPFDEHIPHQASATAFLKPLQPGTSMPGVPVPEGRPTIARRFNAGNAKSALAPVPRDGQKLAKNKGQAIDWCICYPTSPALL